MEEKAALLRGLPADGAAIVNADNYYCREVMEGVDCHLVTFGTWEDADVYGVEPFATTDGIGFYLYDRMRVELPALGAHNVANALAAVAVGLWLDRDPVQVRDALARYQPPPMRMSRQQVGDVLFVNDAYNANPRSMEAAIRELASRPSSGRRVAVLGEMLELGEESRVHHESLGRKVANAKIDVLWAIGDNAEAMAREALRLGLPADAVAWHATTEEALQSPPFTPEPGDTWLFKASRGLALERLLDRVTEMVVTDDATYTMDRPRA
jgi:UDP-N-acetylmuramyl pentapeptide synthase